MNNIHACSICKKKIKDFLNLGNHPCADTFLKKKIDAINLKKYPLIVGFCKCSHMKAIYKVSRNERYKKNKYSYTSNNSPVSIAHFNYIAKKLVKEFKIDKTKKVIEIGSNDGTFLQNIKKYSEANILGIDPSDNMCELALKKKIKTLNIFFEKNKVKKILNKYGKFDLLYGANVFNHVEDPLDFLFACKSIVKRAGIIVLEVPDLESLFKNVGFDTIYHEHRQYYSKPSLIKAFQKVNINVIKIDYIDYMSGSLRVFAKNESFVKKKIFRGNNINKEDFYKFVKNIFFIKKKIIEFINENKKNNKIIVGIGAATKGNTLLNFCNIKSKDIECVLDTSPHKIGKYMPGSGVVIKDEKKIKIFDCAIILPWNITAYLINKFYRNKKISYISIFKITKNLNE